MIYTISLDLYIDSDEIISEEEIVVTLKRLINSASVNASNIKVYDIND